MTSFFYYLKFKWQLFLITSVVILMFGCGDGGKKTIITSPIVSPTVQRSVNLSSPLIGVLVAAEFWNKCAPFKETGGQWTYVELLWSNVESEDGIFDFSVVDKLIKYSMDCSIDLALKIRTGQLPWATTGVQQYSPSAERPSYPPKDLTKYREFIRELSSHIKENGNGKIIRLAIENEAHSEDWWAGEIEEYQNLLKAAFDEIRKVDPDGIYLKIADFGVASEAYLPIITRDIYETKGASKAISFCNDYTAHRGRECPVTEDELKSLINTQSNIRLYEFVTTHLKEDSSYYDIYQLHFYEEWNLLPDVIDWIKAQMAKNKFDKTIEAWEIGYAWQIDGYDNIDHAQDLIRVMVVALGAGVERVNYLPYLPVTSEEIWKGLYDPAGKPRPALSSYKTLIKEIGSSTSVDVLSFVNTDIYGYKFNALSREVYLLWSIQPETISLPIKDNKVTITDYMGDVSEEYPSNISISSDPVFVF